MQKKNVVVIGGGTGSFTVLSGLKHAKDLNLTAIVAMSDNGGSTGKLRDELGVLPPGDVRQCLVALAESPMIIRELFSYRFDSGDLAGHNFGNLFLSALEKITGSFEEAIETTSHILSIRGKVIPVTHTNSNLKITLNDNTEIFGEDTIGNSNFSSIGVQSIQLTPDASLNPLAEHAILNADAIIIGPGNIYCSLLPNMIVPGMKEALQKTKATIIYNVNLMAKYGHCDDWTVQDYVNTMHRWIGDTVIDIALYNTTIPKEDLIERYRDEGEPVTLAQNQNIEGKTQLVGRDLVAEGIYINPAKKDPLKRTLIRHDSLKLANALYELV